MGNCICFRESNKESVVPPNAEAVLQSRSKSALPSNSKVVVPVEIDATTPSNTKSVIPSVNLSNASCFPNKDAQGTKNLPCNPVIHGDVEDFRHIASYENLIMFTYDELRLSTRNFRQDLILGEGGFGLVYKGVLDENIRPGIKAMFVAIKDLNRDGLQGDREWLAEVNYLGQLSHPNLVKLIGYCCQDDHRLLVYEYMACGSLEKHLFQRIPQTISWTTRLKIALDVAKGLAFLHGAKRPIIYRDFKTSNILLDADYNAKLSDFGLAKEGPVGDKTHVSTRVMGTYGYAAPEYVMTGHLTARSDVYGFGVVLLEMLVGRRALDTSRPGREHNLVEWARPILIRCNKLPRIVDPRMSGQYSNKAAQRVANLAYQCLSENPKGRPTMSEVVSALEACLSANEHDAPQLHGERATVAPERQKRKQNRRWMSDPPVDFDPRGASPEPRFVNRVGDLTPDRYRQPHHA